MMNKFIGITKQYSRVNEKFVTNEGYEIEIIEYFGCNNCTIKFKDGTEVKNLKYSQIKKGQIKNLFNKSIFGVGYIGVGLYSFKHNKKIYRAWYNMLRRCYNKEAQKKRPTYKEVVVSEEWHNYQNFAEWFQSNYIEGFHLDKDILSKCNKIYSPETCAFVPQEINQLFVKSDNVRGNYPIGVRIKKNGLFEARVLKYKKSFYLGVFNTVEKAFQAYKIAKEGHIKEVADKWKPFIAPETYQAMYNYKVEFND